MTFIIATCQFHCKSEHKEVKRSKITRKCANLTVFFLIYKVVTISMKFKTF